VGSVHDGRHVLSAEACRALCTTVMHRDRRVHFGVTCRPPYRATAADERGYAFARLRIGANCFHVRVLAMSRFVSHARRAVATP
jgi:hypothetical protein